MQSICPHQFLSIFIDFFFISDCISLAMASEICDDLSIFVGAFSKSQNCIYLSTAADDSSLILRCALSPNRISRSDRRCAPVRSIDLPDRKIPISRRYDNLASASFFCLTSVQCRCHHSQKHLCWLCCAKRVNFAQILFEKAYLRNFTVYLTLHFFFCKLRTAQRY